MTIIEGDGSTDVVKITSVNNVNFTGFTVRNGGGWIGILLWSASNCNVTNCTAYGNGVGLRVDWGCYHDRIANCNFTDNSGTGVVLTYIHNCNISNCIIDNSDTGLSMHASSCTMTNSSITNSNLNDVALNANSVLMFINTTFNKTKSCFFDSSSEIGVKWYLLVKVVNSTNVSVPGATVRVRDNANGTFDQNHTTSTDGWVRWVECTEYLQNSTTVIYYIPYNITVNKTGYAINYSEPMMNSSKYITIILSSTLVGLWHFDENSGSIAYDSSDNGNNGTIYGATWGTGVNGSALSFDGIDDYIEVPNDDSLNFIDQFSIEAWVNLRDLIGRYEIVRKGFSYTLWIWYGKPKASVPVNGTGFEAEGIPLETGNWSLVSMTFGNQNLSIYVNGNLIETTLCSDGSIDPDYGPITIGVDNYKLTWFNGTIDEVRIYDRALSASEILAHYQEYVNQPPTANFTYTPSSPTTADAIQFNDTSTDSDGTIVSWSWEFGDGATATVENPTHQYSDDGTYLINLTVTDDDSATNTTQDSITVSNVAPTANFTYTPASPTTADTIQFNDTSTDSDGTIASWYWDFDDGTNSTLQNPTHIFCDDGVYNITLTVTDNDGATNTTQQSVTVSAANLPPVANFTFSPSNPTTADTVTFTDTSTDSDGTIVSWAWQFGDGATATAQNPTHQYTDDGTYLVNLTVTDDDSATNTTQQSVSVSNVAPTADFTYTPSSPTTADTIQFTDTSTDSDGTLVSWSWEFGDGSTSTAQNPTHQYSADGTYLVNLTVTDDDGASDTCQRSVTVTTDTLAPAITYTSITRTIDVSTTRTTTLIANATDANLTASPWSVAVYESDNVTFVANLTVSCVSSGSGYYNMSATWDATNWMGVPVPDGTYIIRLTVTDLANNSAQVNLTVAVYNMKERILEIILQDQYGNPVDPNNIEQSKTYLVGASIQNLESTDTSTLLIIQIKSASGKVVYITTASGNLPADYIFNLTSSWYVLPTTTPPGEYIVEAFAWNHWISQDPFTWEQLARKVTMNITVVSSKSAHVGNDIELFHINRAIMPLT